MWCLETLVIVNNLAYQQIKDSKPEREALFLLTDERKSRELKVKQEPRNGKPIGNIG
jgi:hypothetical protein